MAMCENGARRIAAELARALKVSVKQAPRAPTGYILFCNAQRAIGPPSGDTPTEKMKELGARWQSADDATKGRYNDESARLKVELASQPPDEPEPGSLPGILKVRDEKQLEVLSKKLINEAMKGFWEDMQANAEEENPFRVTGHGMMRPAISADGKSVVVTLKTKREAAKPKEPKEPKETETE